jgi:uncharacterized BrkB/YihY/UPF0761 family membrane protein
MDKWWEKAPRVLYRSFLTSIALLLFNVAGIVLVSLLFGPSSAMMDRLAAVFETLNWVSGVFALSISMLAIVYWTTSLLLLLMENAGLPKKSPERLPTASRAVESPHPNS